MSTSPPLLANAMETDLNPLVTIMVALVSLVVTVVVVLKQALELLSR